MPRPAELGAAKGVGDHLGNRRTGMHFGAVLGHRPEHADGIHALVRLLQAVGALHRPAEGHHCVPFRSGGGQPGDQVGAARPGGDQRHPGLAGQAADRRRHKGRVGLMAHHHRFNRWRVLQRIEHPVDLGARNAENVFDALRFQVFTTKSAPHCQSLPVFPVPWFHLLRKRSPGLALGGTNRAIQILWTEVGAQEIRIMRQLKIETGDDAELQAAMIELVIQHVAAAAAVVGNEVFVIAGHADALHVIGRAEADQRAAPLMEREGRLLFYRFQHWAVRPFLTRHGTGFHVAELAVDPHRAKQVRRGDLLVDALVQLRLGDWPVELLADAGLEKGDDGEGVFCCRPAGRALPSARSWCIS